MKNKRKRVKTKRNDIWYYNLEGETIKVIYPNGTTWVSKPLNGGPCKIWNDGSRDWDPQSHAGFEKPAWE
jgi:hypothetical protein